MKTILVPVEDHDAMPAVLEAAWLIAQLFDSYIEGCAVRPVIQSYLSVLEPVSGLALSTTDDDEGIEQARGRFEAFMEVHGVPSSRGEPGEGSPGCSYGWRYGNALDDSEIGSYGRVFDLIVLGRPGREPQKPRMPPLESALFESGRPVLIVPPGAPTLLISNVLIAWNGSTEQSRTNAFALPLLRLADQVTLLTVEGATTPGPSGEEATLHLRRNGVKASALTLQTGGRAPGEVILDHAASIGSGLLVKGAYTQSRLRQMIMGGTTRHILANAMVPVLMAH
jgi:nucleotide-binding universal stress UspA family protein